ncbi:hypothetical protein F1737_07750 [Methanoplanus sp. FWC-SCC4]|uniref:4Fe-4S domain-containing protein n=1 Tax=Methanochimaera problematica TaxID=2609417 RepID=A0AA97FE41_9EURY|nr:DUF2148 domain-containing protein [Methanoplanus sp. FWC-SCC4]WOF16593.1 hypothetical protein F1737_07750 [Methanoplanus sp. FWC-SCC4]
MSIEKNGVMTVAELMAVSARTAPKSKGSDVISVIIASGEELNTLAESMKEFGEKHNLSFFIRDAGNIEQSDCCVIIGAKRDGSLGLNCGGCGFLTCRDMLDAQTGVSCGKNPAFEGPNCIIRQADLGIAVGSAVKTASIHNVDNRVMFSAGVGALKLGWLGSCTVAYAIPLSASGKSIFFDRT